MIKLGLQSLSYRDTFLAGGIDLEGFLDRAGEMRLDGVDLHYTHFASTDGDYLERVRLSALRKGLHISYIGVSNDFGRTGDELEAQKRLVREWVDVAARMGVQMVRVFGAWVPQGEPEEDVWDRLIAASRECAAYARSNNVVLGLHNHNHGCVPATGDQTLRLLDAVGDDYYSHILDTGQYRGSPGATGARGKPDPRYDFYGSIAASAPRAVHVRAKIYRIATGEERWLDYDRIIPILKDASFNGWMSIVYEGQDEEAEETAVPKAVSFLREMLRTHDL